jgi:antitoxin component of RelBE/YafQ-DinJ toxin-antitoxin module
MKTSHIHIKIDSDTKKRFDDICQNKSINQSALIRKWIYEYIISEYQEESKLDK